MATPSADHPLITRSRSAPAAHHEGLHQNRQGAQPRLALRALHSQDVRDHGLAWTRLDSTRLRPTAV